MTSHLYRYAVRGYSQSGETENRRVFGTGSTSVYTVNFRVVSKCSTKGVGHLQVLGFSGIVQYGSTRHTKKYASRVKPILIPVVIISTRTD